MLLSTAHSCIQGFSLTPVCLRELDTKLVLLSCSQTLSKTPSKKGGGLALVNSVLAYGGIHQTLLSHVRVPYRVSGNETNMKQTQRVGGELVMLILHLQWISTSKSKWRLVANK